MKKQRTVYHSDGQSVKINVRRGVFYRLAMALIGKGWLWGLAVLLLLPRTAISATAQGSVMLMQCLSPTGVLESCGSTTGADFGPSTATLSVRLDDVATATATILVPYTGATSNVVLGNNSLSTNYGITATTGVFGASAIPSGNAVILSSGSVIIRSTSTASGNVELAVESAAGARPFYVTNAGNMTANQLSTLNLYGTGSSPILMSGAGGLSITGQVTVASSVTVRGGGGLAAFYGVTAATGAFGVASPCSTCTLQVAGTLVYRGSTDGSAAGPGEVGEIISSAGSARTPASNTNVSFATITLTSGTWDIEAYGAFTPGTSNTQVIMAISSVNDDFDAANLSGRYQHSQAYTASASEYFPIGRRRVVLTSTTPYYLSCLVTWTGTAGTCSASSIIYAERTR